MCADMHTDVHNAIGCTDLDSLEFTSACFLKVTALTDIVD